MSFKTALARLTAAELLAGDTLLTLTSRPAARANRTLIVRLDAIGDFILWLDAAHALARRQKACGETTILVANAAWASWASELAIFDEVIALDVRDYLGKPLYRHRMNRKIRASGCILAINPTYSRGWLLDDSVMHISGAQQRIGSAGDRAGLRPWQVRIANSWYTSLLAADAAPLMELERNAEFMRNLGETNFRAKLPALNLSIIRQTLNPVTQEIPGGSPYYVLFPGASRIAKQWPVSGFAEIATNLYERTGWHGIICGGAADTRVAEQVIRLSSAPLLDWTGKTDLPQLASILFGARLLLTNDTSAAHIGPATGIPTVCILGGGHYGRFLPYKIDQEVQASLPRAVIHPMPCFGCNWNCIYKPSPNQPVPCIERIQADDVWRAVRQVAGIGLKTIRPESGNSSRSTRRG